MQEAWLRFSRASDIDVVPAWLTTVVTRLCLDQLRRRRSGNIPLDTAQPEQVDDARLLADPCAEVVLGEQVAEALQIVLDSLTPAERVAFILHDVFGFAFEEIGTTMGRSASAVRQLASRARRRVQGESETDVERATNANNQRVVDAFLSAAHGGDLDTLVALLAPDTIMRADQVAQAMGANASYDGARAVARRFSGSKGAVAATIDDELGAAWFQGGSLKVAFVFHVENGLVTEVEQIADPEILATLDVRRVRSGAAARHPVQPQ